MANIYLTPLDRKLERRGLAFCRYADDITIYVSSERSAERVLTSVVRWIERDLKLQVDRAKSGTGRPWERQTLGFRLLEDGTIAVAPKSLEQLPAGGAPPVGRTPEPDQ
jgi:retron-type reverse transcriptase